MPHYKLKIKEITLPVFLGIYEHEKITKSIVKIDIELSFPQQPDSCNSDEYKNTLCYEKITSFLERNFSGKNYDLLEYLSQLIFESIKKEFCQDILVRLEVRKYSHGLKNVVGYVGFSIDEY